MVSSITYGLRDRFLGFLTLIRPIFFILTPFNAASAAVLAFGGFPSLAQCLSGFIAVAFASCAINVSNDYIDKDRDKYIWPDRPIPSGRVRPGEALILVAITGITSLIISWFVFNPTTFFILALAIALGILYSAFLRDRIGYLSLPPIVGMIYLGGWAAFSPETLLSNLLPWYLYLLGVIWQTAHIVIYYPLHEIPNTDNKLHIKLMPTFLGLPTTKTIIKIGIVFTCLTAAMGIGLFFIASLSILYIIFVVAATIYTLLNEVKLLEDAMSRKKGIAAFSSLSILRLIISTAILLSVLLVQNVSWWRV